MARKPTAPPKDKPKKPTARREATPRVVKEAPPANATAWERRKNESIEAFRAFLAYRDLGLERTLMKTCLALDKGKRYMRSVEGWSSPQNHEWQERCRMWDDAEQKRKDKEHAEDERRVWKDAQIKERDRRKRLLEKAYSVAWANLSKLAPTKNQLDPDTGQLIGYEADPDTLRATITAFDKYMVQSRQEFNDLPTQKIAPVDARDPEGETPYQSRLEDTAHIIAAVREMMSADDSDD